MSIKELTKSRIILTVLITAILLGTAFFINSKIETKDKMMARSEKYAASEILEMYPSNLCILINRRILLYTHQYTYRVYDGFKYIDVVLEVEPYRKATKQISIHKKEDDKLLNDLSLFCQNPQIENLVYLFEEEKPLQLKSATLSADEFDLEKATEYCKKYSSCRFFFKTLSGNYTYEPNEEIIKEVNALL